MTVTASPSSLEQVRSIAAQMAGNAADAMALGSQLVDAIRRLPPDSSEILTRPEWQRATLWTLGASFENIDADEVNEVPPQNIRIPRDMWIRGVEAQVILSYDLQTIANQLGTRHWATNGRWAVDLNWRIDGSQGFTSDGESEILSVAASITGDVRFSAPLDWQLQTDQTIEVRLRPRIRDIFAAGVDSPSAIRWAVVTFFGEQLSQRSVR